MQEAHLAQPLWLRILQFPLTRVIVLGGLALSMMAWTESRILAFKDSPLIGVAIAIVMAVMVMAVYVAWGKLIERREVTELSLPGAGREWAFGGLVGARLYAGCVLLLMVFGMFQIEGPTFYTGSNFGMEQSVFALILCTITGVVLLVIAIRRGHMVPAPWNRKG